MIKKLFFSINCIIVALLFSPSVTLAVDYQITDVKIEAHLQENGDVFVKEKHTYTFNSEFNGIIREIVPKVGTDIIQLLAFENSEQLNIDTDGYEHRIFRAGKDETITIDINYTVVNGVDVYADIAEFYWAFFDRRNQSNYENIVIHIFPPAPTETVIAFGYNEAYGTESINENGDVQFRLGSVEKKQNGDIRVGYEADLFEGASHIKQVYMAEKLVAEKEGLLAASLKHAKMKGSLEIVAIVLLPLFSFLLIILLARSWQRTKEKKRIIMKDLENSPLVPKLRLPLIATMFYVTYRQFTPQLMTAALLDLVRKGNVECDDNERFHFVSAKGLSVSENLFTEWLFTEIGSDNQFCFADLSSYLKKSKNHSTYYAAITKWLKALAEELKEASLFEESKKYRWSVVFSSLVLIPPFALFLAYGLYSAAIVSLSLFFTAIFYAAFYNPKTELGGRIIYEWRAFKNHLKAITEKEWQEMTEDERMRAFIFGVATKEKNFHVTREKTGEFKAEKGMVCSIDPILLMTAATASVGFKSASDTTGSSASNSSSMGGGTGGGGGGSGAF